MWSDPEEGETGFVIPKSDKETLEQHLKELVVSQKRRIDMGEKGHHLYTERYTFDVMYKNTNKVYKEVLSAA